LILRGYKFDRYKIKTRMYRKNSFCSWQIAIFNNFTIQDLTFACIIIFFEFEI
jgi:hypothetical protein